MSDPQVMAHFSVIQGIDNRIQIGDRSDPLANPPYEAPVASGTSTAEIGAVFRLSEIGETALIIPEVSLTDIVATTETRSGVTWLVVTGVLTLAKAAIAGLVKGGTYDHVIWLTQSGIPIAPMAFGEIVVFDVEA